MDCCLDSAGATVTVDIPVTVSTSATVAAGQRNTATINIAGLTGFNDTDTSNNSSSFVDVTVQPRYNLLVTKDNSATALTTGQTVTYTITVNNSGPSTASNVQVTDTLPSQLQFVSATSGGTAIGSATDKIIRRPSQHSLQERPPRFSWLRLSELTRQETLPTLLT